MAELAINGGKPVVSEGLKIKWPIFDDADKKALIEVFESGKWCSVKQPEGKVAQVEKEFARFIGTKYAMAVPNGTDALILAFKACGIGAGDEVIVPAVSFISSASAVILANAVPIFVDIDPETYQISPKAMEEAITDRTRAIETVHYGGYPADMDRIIEIAQRHNLLVIEDAAEAHGSEWRGKKIGSIGNMGCFSFQMGKPLTCGEGGAVTYDDESLAISCYSYARLGRRPGGEEYVHHIPAGNFRMSEFLGAILLTQLQRLKEQVETRHKNGKYFAKELEKIEGISTLKKDPRITKRSYYFYFLKYDSSKWNNIHRDRFMQALKAEGVPCSTAHNDPLYKNPAFQDMVFGNNGCPVTCSFYGKKIDYSRVHCPEAERIYRSEIVALGKDFLMERENVDRILEAIHKIRDNVEELK